MAHPITRRTFMQGAGLGAGAAVAGAPEPAHAARHMGSRPNIVVVLVDDMRWDQLGIAGHPFVQTPHLDRLGREGALFTNAFACTPLCSPSRASTLTGQYPHTHRIINNDRNGLDFISHKLVTFPQMYRRIGYETAYIGKWHMGPDDTRRPGFDHWISFRGQGLYLDPVVNIDDRRVQCDGYMTDLLNGWAVDFAARERDRPFLLFLSHKAVHGPFIPAPRHDTLYAGERYVPPPGAADDLSGKPVLTRDVPPVDPKFILGATPEPSEPRYGRSTARDAVYLDHFRCLNSVDDGIGMLFDALEATGQLDNTLFLFTSDNGFLFGEHGEFMNKRMAYEESLRVPLLIRWPERIAPGTVREQMVLNLDIAPTLYDLAGIDPPVRQHGLSLLPVIDDPEHPLRSHFLAEHFVEAISPRHPTWQAVRTEDWKLIHYPELASMDELYHLAQDPHELDNRIANPSAQPHLSALRQLLATRLSETGG